MHRVLYISATLLPSVSLCSSLHKTTDRPNIVCIVSEDNSAEYMSLFCEGRGTHTPAIEALAREGVIFENTYSNAPVSSAARSTLISGCYGVSMSSHQHRAEVMVDMPEGLKMFPAYMRKAGYYTANNAKEDYNITKGDDVWDDSSRGATWRNRAEGQPFYYVYNMGDTHEGQMLKSLEQMQSEVGEYQPACGVYIQPNYPNTELFRTAYRFYCKLIEQMDRKVAHVIQELDKDGLLDNTIILYYGDNGGIMPNSKGYLTEMGLNVPLVIRIPDKYHHLADIKIGSRDKRAVSFVDLAATILNMAGITPPEAMDGVPVWRRGEEDLLIGYADRMGEKYDMVRTIRKGRYKYVRSFQPFNFDALSNLYRSKLPTYQELRRLYNDGKLNAVQSQFFIPKAPEALYDIKEDPYELNNLATDRTKREVLLDLRRKMVDFQLKNNDIGLLPEYYWAREAGAATATYGKANSKRIERYLQIANLQLENYVDAHSNLIKALESLDEVDRYWALCVCSSFGNEAKDLVPKIKAIAKSDQAAEIRVRAAEYLALYCDVAPQDVMLSALYSTKDPIEATLILNSMTLLSEGAQHYKFSVNHTKLAESLTNHTLVKSALKKHGVTK